MFESFSNLFPVTKTLAFRLVPVGDTESYVKKARYIEGAEDLAADYAVVKTVADRFHKKFIEEVLSKFRIKYASDGSLDSLQEYADIFFLRGEKAREDIAGEGFDRDGALDEISSRMKEAVACAFAGQKYGGMKMLDAMRGKSFVCDLLAHEASTLEEKEAVARMSKYTSYMSNYETVKEMMYDPVIGHNSIESRIINDNLPIHLSNVRLFGLLPDEVVSGAAEIMKAVSERFVVSDVQDVFTVSYFSLLAPQSAIDAYNVLIGGLSLEDGSRIQGINELVNLYNQKNRTSVRMLRKLRKQILSDREPLSWLPETFPGDKEVVAAVRGIRELVDGEVVPAVTILEKGGFDLAKVYVDAKSISRYSHCLYGDWNAVERCIRMGNAEAAPRKAKETDASFVKRMDRMYGKRKSYSVSEIEDAVRKYEPAFAGGFSDYVRKHVVSHLAEALSEYASLEDSLRELSVGTRLGYDLFAGSRGCGTAIKGFLDGMNEVKRNVCLFTDGNGLLDCDVVFYDKVFGPVREFAWRFRKVYDSIRNYLTKKPYSTDKVRVYFGNPDLLRGWDVSRVKSSRSVILREDGRLYLCIIPRGSSANLVEEKFSPLEKLDVKLIPNPHMALPKKAFSQKGREQFDIPKAVDELYLSGKNVKDYNSGEVGMMIDFYKYVITSVPEWEVFGFKFKETGEYARLNDFYDDVREQAMCSSWNGVSREMLEECVRDGSLLLFQITSQDFSEKHHGKDGDYKELLLEAVSGRRDSRVRLCGNGAIYFRKASIPARVTHPAGVPMKNKNPDNPSRTRTLAYDLIKDRRYTEDRYAFHLPVLINPTANKNNRIRINGLVREVVKRNPGMYVLGVNRGERNLVSIAVTAPDGRIVEQRNLNVFDNFDYRRKLAERENERSADRRNWNAVQGIKDIKAGYLSRAVGEIARLVKKYRCIVAVENLDREFKDGRQRFEKNVYQQFETALVKKLGLYMDKNEDRRVGTALQLTDPTATADHRYSQNGAVLFVSPLWVTKTDPLTGFAIKWAPVVTTVKESEALVCRFRGFRYVPAKDRFVLSVTQRDVVRDCYFNGDPDRIWDIETFGERVEMTGPSPDNPFGVRKTVIVQLTEAMKDLLDSYGVDYTSGMDLRSELLGHGKDFLKEFFRIIRLTLCNTNYYPSTGEYRVAGCTADASGRIYDSRDADVSMPKDGDVNAAWNIARKAHMILRNVREFIPGVTMEKDLDGVDTKKVAKGPRMIVATQEWFRHVQRKKSVTHE